MDPGTGSRSGAPLARWSLVAAGSRPYDGVLPSVAGLAAVGRCARRTTLATVTESSPGPVDTPGRGPAPISAEPVWRRPDPALLRVRRGLVLGLFTGPGLLASLALLVLVGRLQALAVVLIVGTVTGLLLQAVRRRYEAWGYLERDDDLLVRRGVLVRRTSVVPYGRMQYVDVTAGPLDRRMGLATVTLHTAAAATDASIPGLRSLEAARLRDRLAALGEAHQAGV